MTKNWAATHFAKLGQTAQYLTLRPFDASTEKGRSDERYRRAAISTTASMFARATGVLTPLLTVPITLSYLGTERYGVWMTLASLSSSLAFADLGIGLGLLNKVSGCHGRNDVEEAHAYVSSGFFLLLAVATVLGVLFLASHARIPWSILFKTSSPSALNGIQSAFTAFVVCLLLNIPLGVIDRVFLAYQESLSRSIAQIICGALSVSGVFLVVKLNWGIAALVIAVSGAPVLGLLTNGAELFLLRRPWLTPKITLVRGALVRELLNTGTLFFFLQLCGAIGYTSDNLVIAHFRGVAAVATYVVPSRIFAVAGSLISPLMIQLWPAFTEATSRGDVAWVRKTFTRVILLTLFAVCPSEAVLLLLGKPLVRAWTHGQVVPSSPMLCALALWGIISALSGAAGMFMNSMNVIRFQVIGASAAAILNLSLSMILTERFGPIGVVLGSSIAQSIYLIPIFCLVIPKLLHRLEESTKRLADLATT